MPLTLLAQKKNLPKKPKKIVEVNKAYDEEGNLIRYDSTFVYSWASDSVLPSFPDSLPFLGMGIDKIQEYVKQQFDVFFETDSTNASKQTSPFSLEKFFDRSFYPEDFDKNNFLKGLEEMMPNIDQMHQEFRQWQEKLKKQIKSHQQRDSIR